MRLATVDCGNSAVSLDSPTTRFLACQISDFVAEGPLPWGGWFDWRRLTWQQRPVVTTPPSHIDPEALRQVRDALRQHTASRPPTIGIIGVSGVGKSSTINALFKTSLATSATAACTKEFLAVDLSTEVSKGPAQGQQTVLRVVDAPGLGEDTARDPAYLRMYEQHLGACDVVLWVLAARNRALALDQMYLRRLEAHHSKMVFGISQIDLVDPCNWDRRLNLPSPEQERNIAAIVDNRAAILQRACSVPVRTIPYSSTTGFNLERLFHFLLQAAPASRAWLFDGLKNFSYRDFIPPKVQKVLERRRELL